MLKTDTEIEEIRGVINTFIEKEGSRIEEMYNVQLSMPGDRMEALEENEESIYLEYWTITNRDEYCEACYRQEITEEEDVEVLLEIRSTAEGYAVADWDVKTYF